MQSKLVEFIRKRDYKIVEELGQGACGKTVLLYDDMIDEQFVCKKYHPFSEDHRQELFSNFVREVKLLHQIHHANVVRVFNYYLYPDQFTGYILMEFVDGSDIEDYIKATPEKINEIFLQVINGFLYLETQNILHRDIRPQNIMVTSKGNVKIIDLGFGKKIQRSKDFDKSISLNLWCEPPEEFKDALYDFTTEVYFVGKLFEKIIYENNIDHFEHKDVLQKMCIREHDLRIMSFFHIEMDLNNNRFYEIDFSEEEQSAYRHFSGLMYKHISKIENGSKYVDDIIRIQNELEDAYRSFMLEETAPDSALILGCFINGSYYYKKGKFPVYAVRDFLHLFKSTSREKRRIILSNLHTRFDSIDRYSESQVDNEVPF